MEPYDLLRSFVAAAEQLGLRYLVTGSLATIAFGESRFTNDIDVVVELPPEKVQPLCACFPAPEYYVSETAARQAVLEQRQFNIIHPASGFKIDVIVAKQAPFDISRLSRAVRMTTGEGLQVSFSSPEDIIVKKLDFYRMGESDKHLRDITGILKSRGSQLDYDYLAKWIGEFQLDEIWQAVLKRHQGTS